MWELSEELIPGKHAEFARHMRRSEKIDLRTMKGKVLWLYNLDQTKEYRSRTILRRIEEESGIAIGTRIAPAMTRRLIAGHGDALIQTGNVDATPQERGVCCWLKRGPFRKEADCTAAMEKESLQAHKRGKILFGELHCQRRHGARTEIRLAQDIMQNCAVKQYYYIICTAMHKRGHVCDPLPESYYEKDEHLYEVVRDSAARRHYFDIEWLAENEFQTGPFYTLLKAFKEFMDLPAEKTQKFFVTKGSRWKNEQSYKHSYHVIYRDIILPDKDQHALMMMRFKDFLSKSIYAEELAEVADSYKILTKRSYVYKYDGAVYTKNRLMRLPNQCKPGGTVPLIVDKDKTTIFEPITISVNAVLKDCIKPPEVTPEEGKMMRDSLYGLAPIHRVHKETILDPIREKLRLAVKEKNKKKESEFYSSNLTKPSEDQNMDCDTIYPQYSDWRDINLIELRKTRGYDAYIQFLGAIIDVFEVLREDIVEHMGHSKIEKAHRLYDYIKETNKDKELKGVHCRLLIKYGLISEHQAENLLKDYFYTAKDNIPSLIPKNNGFGVRPEFVERVQLCDDSSVEIVTGAMGVGKTEKIIDRISFCPEGSTVIYIVGRVRLADELVVRLNQRGMINASRFHYSEIMQDRINVFVAVINSLCKFEDLKPYFVVVDEQETTFSNLKMGNVDRQAAQNLIMRFVKESHQAKFCDAMMTMPSIVFAQAMARYVLEDDNALRFTKLIRENDEKRSRVICPLFNDIISINLYNEKMTYYRPAVGNNGFLIRFLFEMGMNHKVAVAVPTIHWANTIQKLVPLNKNVVRIDGKTKKKNRNKAMSSADVLIYTSAISAGHSIDIKNHFQCVFVVVNSPVIETQGNRVVWKTPDLGEVSQMAGRVRHPITPNVYLTVSGGFDGRKKPAYLHTSGYMVGNDIAFDLLTSGESFLTTKMGMLSKHEFAIFVQRWFARIAFPGSTIKDEMLTDPSVVNVLTDNLGKMNEVREEFEILNFCSKDERRAILFEERGGKRYRKKVGKQTMNSFPDLNFLACGEGQYVIMIGEGGSGQIFK